MRPWFKYVVTDSFGVSANQSKTTDFKEDEQGIDFYQEAAAYESKESFFDTYFIGNRRKQNYDEFICRHITAGERVLGVGSGRCANELMLMDRGHEVVCSDLTLPHSVGATKKLFPKFEQINLDILSGPAEEQFDVVICLGVIYLFDDSELRRFFENAYDSLKTGGRLIFDSAGSTDNLLSHWINDIYLRHETRLYRLFRSLKYRKRHMVITKHHGYRRTNEDIVNAASLCGFQFVSRKDYDFLTEFERAIAIRRLLRIVPPLAWVFERLGRTIPYTRMYELRKA